MFHYNLIVCIFAFVLEASARPQYQCSLPCAVQHTQPVTPAYAQPPTLNILVRTEPNEKPAEKSEPYPNYSCPPPCPCPCPCQSHPAPRRFCASICAIPGAIMDSLLGGELNL